MSRSTQGSLLGLIVAAALSTAAVASTHGVFSQTVDEPGHIAAGLEWIQQGSYTLWTENPPLARIAVALGPHLTGATLAPAALWANRRAAPATGTALGNDVLYQHGAYRSNLSRARAAVLPFLVLLLAVTWLWGLRAAGPGAALLAAAAVATLPSVLAHAGLATTDLPFTALLLLALYAFARWLERPAPIRAVVAGSAFALALATKFSTLVMFPAAALALLGFRILELRAGSSDPRTRAVPLPRVAGGMAAGAVAGLVVLWAAYGFSFGPLTALPDRVGPWIAAAQPPATLLGDAPVPAPELFHGLSFLAAHQETGHDAFALGRVSISGFWYYYPLSLALKTPVPFLLFALAGLGALFGRERLVAWLGRRGPAERATGEAARAGDWLGRAAGVGGMLILLILVPARINIGVRHMLPVFPLLAIGAAAGLVRVGARRPFVIGAAIGLLAWQTAVAVRAHPDHLAYFNPLAGDDPGALLNDSNLDWGQDLLRLGDYLETQAAAESIRIAYFGTADPCFHLPAEVSILPPGTPVTGWVAVSDMYRRGIFTFLPRDACDITTMAQLPPSRDWYAWLDGHDPVATVGETIRVYRIEGPIPRPPR